jgi:hypothetical protein
MSSGFPIPQRRRIDAQLLGHFSLRQTERPPRGGKALRERGRGLLRVITQEPNDGRDVADFGNGCVDFPIGNRELMNADAVGDLFLQELEV